MNIARLHYDHRPTAAQARAAMDDDRALRSLHQNVEVALIDIMDTAQGLGDGVIAELLAKALTRLNTQVQPERAVTITQIANRRADVGERGFL